MRVYFTEEEQAVLERLVDTALREIRVEVRHAHESDTKAELKHREHVLRQILDKVAVGTPAIAHV